MPQKIDNRRKNTLQVYKNVLNMFLCEKRRLINNIEKDK